MPLAENVFLTEKQWVLKEKYSEDEFKMCYGH